MRTLMRSKRQHVERKIVFPLIGTERRYLWPGRKQWENPVQSSCRRRAVEHGFTPTREHPGSPRWKCKPSQAEGFGGDLIRNYFWDFAVLASWPWRSHTRQWAAFPSVESLCIPMAAAQPSSGPLHCPYQGLANPYRGLTKCAFLLLFSV